jgi:hypothetical protein
MKGRGERILMPEIYICVEDTLSRFDPEGPSGYNASYMRGHIVRNIGIDKKGIVKGYYQDNSSKTREEGKDRMRFKVVTEQGYETDWLESKCQVLPTNAK